MSTVYYENNLLYPIFFRGNTRYKMSINSNTIIQSQSEIKGYTCTMEHNLFNLFISLILVFLLVHSCFPHFLTTVPKIGLAAA